MKNKKIINFKYKTPVLTNIVSFLFFIAYLIIIFLIIKCSMTIINSIILIFIITIITIIILSIICKKINIVNGQFEFNKDELDYSSLNKTYIIKFDEIEYISKESFIDYSNIFHIEKYLYKIKIKDAKYFIFTYYDESLKNAIDELSIHSKIKIDDVSK